jgi:hypothetical protein
MSRSAAKAAAAADALNAWLAARPDRRPSGASPPEDLTVSQESRLSEHDGARASEAVPHGEPASDSSSPACVGGGPSRLRPAEATTVPRLAHTDWLYHRLTITGPEQDLAAFQDAAAGAGIIPWPFNLDRMEEDFFHRLVSPAPLRRRSLSLAGARILARQLRDAVDRRHDLALGIVGRSRACPLDLHALVPVPAAVLALGPDDPATLAWLWEHWGTTEPLRHVAEVTRSSAARSEPPRGPESFVVSFWSADWTPWRALAAIRACWPALRFQARPSYGAA